MRRHDFDVMTPFTRAEACGAGITDRHLSGAAFRKVFPGTYVSCLTPDTLVVRTRAALKVLASDAVVSHHTAARLWGGVVPENPNIHVSFARDVKTNVVGIKAHRFTRQMAVHRRHGLVVTTPEQTFLHLARPLDLVELVVLADSLVRRRITIPQDLGEFARQYGGQGSALAQRAAALSRHRVDSAPETRLRLLMVLAGLPEPVVNHELLRPDGSVEYRLDLSFPGAMLAIEYDGRWHDSPEQRALDEARRADLAARGWTIVIIRAEDLYEDPEGTVSMLHRKLRAHGIPCAGVLNDEWRRHFATSALSA